MTDEIPAHDNVLEPCFQPWATPRYVRVEGWDAGLPIEALSDDEFEALVDRWVAEVRATRRVRLKRSG